MKIEKEMKSFRMNLRNVATIVAILAVALMSSGAMAQNVGDQFQIGYGNYDIMYEVITPTEVKVQGQWMHNTGVFTFPETVSNWGNTYTVTQYDGSFDSGTGPQEYVTEVVFPNSVDTIRGRVWCLNMTNVTFGTGVKFIAGSVFRLGNSGDNPQLATIICNAVIPPNIYNPEVSDNNHAFWNWDELQGWIAGCKVRVPCASLYQNSYWGTVFPSANFVQTATCPATLTVLSSDVAKGHAISLGNGGSAITSTWDFGTTGVTPVTSAPYSGLALLIASAKKDCVFLGWSDGNLEPLRYVNVTGDVTYTAQFTACTNTAIESIPAQSSGLSVYPNPVGNVLNVELNRDVRNGTLALFDLNGKAVVRQNLTGRQAAINLQPLAKGMYILRLVEGGNATAGVKIVKQ
ncbi:hypothetical protein FACS1894181_06750 [Bacteroidia bacterium]|nr:hypothetical protein FACS1894181_06750 [Bacteroidia bacterium]